MGGLGIGVELGLGGECVVACSMRRFGSVECVDGLVVGLIGEVWVRWSEWMLFGGVVSVGGRLCGGGETGYSPGFWQGSSGSERVWLRLSASVLCRSASLG